MALTPEDVVNKRFNPTKFREGYDQDEVDDFLDEVVVELRRLNQENEELRQRLVAGEARISELQRGAAAAAAAAPAALEAAPAVLAAPVAAPEPAFAPEPVAPAPVEAAVEAPTMDPSNTNNLLQLARRLHEEHVREGMEKRDALIAEGHATASRVLSEAQQTQQAQLAGLEQEKQSLENEKQSLQNEKQSLEHQVDELRAFEKEYREKLRGYIEGQLHELETSNPLTVAPAQAEVAAEPEYQPAQAAAPADYTSPESSEFTAYPQPTDYPGFAAGS
ncbi:MAG: DivIVA domain-containing protein [Pseudolysinimonas sp.]